jgi:putative tryptophan/tyrosine transport system substrate-binding protein
MRRREFIALLGGAAAVWPLAARALQGERMRRIGALMAQAEDDPDRGIRVAAFAQGLQQLGWTIGGNVRIDYRWSTGDVERSRYAAELVALKPDVLFATSGATVGALQQATRTVPIVFVTVIDPVGGGWVASLARPGGNATGFGASEFSLSGKWLELAADPVDQFRRAAGYIDRILKGEKPTDLPVQAPTKYELVVNLKTAKAIGLEVPATVLARADEVID